MATDRLGDERQVPAAATDGRPLILTGRLIDLTHPLSWHTPGWVGYPGMKLYYTHAPDQPGRVTAHRDLAARRHPPGRAAAHGLGRGDTSIPLTGSAARA